MKYKLFVASCVLASMIAAQPVAMARHAAENHAREIRVEQEAAIERAAKADAERREKERAAAEQAEKERAEREARVEAERAAEEKAKAEAEEKAKKQADAEVETAVNKNQYDEDENAAKMETPDNAAGNAEKASDAQNPANETLNAGKADKAEKIDNSANVNTQAADKTKADKSDEAVNKERTKEKDEAVANVKESETEGEGLLAHYLRLAREKAASAVGAKTDEKADAKNEKAKEDEKKKEDVSHVKSPVEMREMAYTYEDIGGTLLFSDSPEYVTEPGILYRDTVQGDARVLYYHVNRTRRKARVVVTLANEGDSYAVIHVTRRGASTPSPDYLAVGRATQQSYFESEQKRDAMYLAPGEVRLLTPEMGDVIMKPEDLIYGVVDFSSTAPVKVTVLCAYASDDVIEKSATLPVLKKDDVMLRGTFIGMDRLIRLEDKYNPDDGFASIHLADDDRDKYRSGIDATDGSIVKNYGNYGILYRIEARSSRDNLHAFLCPLGGVYAGAMRIEERRGSSRMVMTPSYGGYFGDAGGEAIIDGAKGIETLMPAAELSDLGLIHGSKDLAFEFTPPGASNLPVRLILAPEHWDK